jgi:hypothetical protein
MNESASGPGGAADEWLDMSRYPSLDPEDGVPDTRLARLREILRGHEVPPLTGRSWAAMIRGALGEDVMGTHVSGEAT